MKEGSSEEAPELSLLDQRIDLGARDEEEVGEAGLEAPGPVQATAIKVTAGMWAR